MDALTHYYGLDWIDAIMTVLAIHFLSQKNRIGFILNIIGATSGLILFTTLMSYPFIALNILLICLNWLGYRKWTRDATA